MTETNNPADPQQQQQIKCPHCGQTYAVRPEQWAQYHGRTINCTRCAQPFTVSAPPEAMMQSSAPPLQQPPGYGPPAGAYGAPAGYPPVGGPAGQPPYGMAYPGYAAPGVGPKTSGWAITSLVAGIVSVVLFCIPFFSLAVALLGVIGGVLGLKRTADNRAGGRGLAIAGLITGCFGALLGALMIIPVIAGTSAFFPALANAREQANRVKCAANMRQIGQALMVYANDNNGTFPSKLEDVLSADPTLDPKAFVCPDDKKTPPSATNAQATAHDIASGQHCSYIYVGDGVTSSASTDTVLLYEPLGLHKKPHNPGMNVLFADGHVEFVKAADAKTILDQQAAGTRPIKVTPGP
jgi:prepilin-type processing-associated H-X9-DG protein